MLKRATIFISLALIAAIFLGGFTSLQGIFATETEAAGPFGDRPEIVDTEGAYQLPSVFVTESSVAATDNELSGTMTVQNATETSIGNLQYRLEVYGDIPGEAPSDDRPLLLEETVARDIPLMSPQEVRTITFHEDLDVRLPTGTYSVRVQILSNRARALGWHTSTIVIKNSSVPFIPVFGAGILLPEYGDKSVAGVTGPNVTGGSHVTFQLLTYNTGTTPIRVTPVLRRATLDPARGYSSDIRLDPITLPVGTQTSTIDVEMPKQPGVYLSEVTLLDQHGLRIGGIAQYRTVVRGLDADILSVRLLNQTSSKGDDLYVKIDHVGSADAETRALGTMTVAVADSEGVAGMVNVPRIQLTDGVARGTAKVPLWRDLGNDPHVTVSLLSQSGQKLAVSDMSLSGMKSLSAIPAWKLSLQWYLQLGSLLSILSIAALILCLAYAVRNAFVRHGRYVGRHVISAFLLVLTFTSQVQTVFAFGGSNGIEVFSPMTVGENQNAVADPVAYQAYWGEIYSSPIVALFVNAPVHRSTVDCRASIPLSLRVEYAACNNAPSAGHIIARYDANGGVQTSLMGSNANWVTAYDRSYYQSPSCSTKACIHNNTFDGRISLASLASTARETTVQVVVKHNAYVDAAHGQQPDATIDPNEVYFQRRFVQAFNLHLTCNAVCGNGGAPEVGEQCDDGNTVNGDGCSSTCQLESPDLQLEKTSNSSSVVAGQSVTYTLTVRNVGPARAENVVVTDPIPGGLTIGTVSSECTVSSNTVSCIAGTVNPGDSRQFTISVQTPVNAVCPGTLTNVAQVVTNSAELNTSNNIATHQMGLTCPSGDLQIQKSGPATLSNDAGSAFTYTFVVQNNTSTPAEHVYVHDVLPQGLSLSSLPSYCSAAGTNPVSVTCDLDIVDPNASRTFTLDVSAPARTLCGATLSNTATVETVSPDNNLGNNQSTAVTQFTCSAVTTDVSVEKTGPATLLRGNQISYSLRVRNNGTASAENLIVTDPVVAGLTFVPSQSDARCSLQASTVTCPLGTMTGGQETTLALRFQTDASLVCGTLTNVAYVNTTTTDTYTGNNQSAAQTSVTCPTEADVQILKSGPATVARGGTLQYTLTVGNVGSSPAASVIVTDAVPGGLTFVPAQSDARCSLQGGSVRCDLGTINPAQQIPLALTFQTSSSTSCGLLTNTANVTTTTTDVYPGNNQSSAQTTVTCVTPTTDVSISKTAPATVSNDASLTLSYALVAANGSSVQADGVTITDQIPSGLTITSVASGCTRAGQTVTCSIGTLPSGGSHSYPVTVSAPARSLCGQSITNTATISTSSNETNTANNTSSATTNVTCTIPTTDVSISKTAPATVSNDIAAIVNYSLVVTNNSSVQADGVTITDQVPANLTVTSVGSGCTTTGQSVTCAIGTLAPNASRTYTVTATASVRSACGQSVTNTAAVSTTTTETNTSNNTSSAVTNFTCTNLTTDLQILKTGPATIARGNTVTYSIVVSNIGLGVAQAVQVTDAVPAGLTFVPAQSDTRCSLQSGSVRCDLGTMNPTQQITLSLTFQTSSTMTCGLFSNTANVTTTTTDTYTGNNQSSAQTTLQCPQNADVSVTKAANAVSVQKGGSVTYTIVAQNAGPGAASNVQVVDTVPSTLQNISASGCTVSGQTVTCSIASLGAGNTQAFTVSATVKNDATVACNSTITNPVTISTSSTESNTTNNSASASINVICPTATYTISKTDGQTQVTPGTTLTYTITVQNTSAVAGTNVTLIDTLPTYLTYVSSSPSASVSGQVLTWTNLSFAANEQKVFTVTATVGGTTPNNTVLRNTAVLNGTLQAIDDTTVIVPVQTGCIDVTKIAQDEQGAQLTSVPAFSFLLDGITQVSNNAQGQARFTNVTVGQHTVSEVAQGAPWVLQSTTPSNGIVNVTSSSTCASVTFVNRRTPTADLSIQKTGPSSVVRGSSMSYTLTVTSSGNSSISNVKVTDAYPRNVLSYSNASGATCTDTGTQIECNLGTLAPNQTTTITLNFTVQNSSSSCSQTTITNTASVSENDTTITETSTSNNTSGTVSTTVSCVGGSIDSLNIRKTDNLSVTYAGDALRYEIALENTSDVEVQNVQVTDPIPSDLVIVTVSDGGSISGQNITWNNISIGARQTKYLYVDTRVNSSATTSRTLSNTATVRDTAGRTKSASDTTLIEADTPYVPPRYNPPRYTPPTYYPQQPVYPTYQQPIVYPLTGGNSSLFSAKIDNADLTVPSSSSATVPDSMLSAVLTFLATMFGVGTSVVGKGVMTGSFL